MLLNFLKIAPRQNFTNSKKNLPGWERFINIYLNSVKPELYNSVSRTIDQTSGIYSIGTINSNILFSKPLASQKDEDFMKNLQKIALFSLSLGLVMPDWYYIFRPGVFSIRALFYSQRLHIGSELLKLNLKNWHQSWEQELVLMMTMMIIFKTHSG